MTSIQGAHQNRNDYRLKQRLTTKRMTIGGIVLDAPEARVYQSSGFSVVQTDEYGTVYALPAGRRINERGDIWQEEKP